jgi:CubicO group peptidase (beta-lactamase class C family)
MAEWLALLERAISDGVTPGAQLSIRWFSPRRSCWVAEDLAVGKLEYAPHSAPVCVNTLYDLASVTKALFALAAVSFAHRERLSLDTRASDLWPESAGYPAGNASLDQLLSHRSELSAWVPLYKEIDVREAGTELARTKVLERLLREPLEHNGHTVRYSDLGYIVAGECFSRASGVSLRTLIEREVLAPLRSTYELQIAYRPVREVAGQNPGPSVAPTERCAWRNTIVHGVVHDENAYALGGVCGHAGLFGTARDLATIGEACLRALEGDGAFSHWITRDVLVAMTSPREGGTHRLGFDGKSPGASSAGTIASEQTFGHLGFTGTMLWCDPVARVAVALVTNRVHPTRENNAIRTLRPAVMDLVFQNLA